MMPDLGSRRARRARLAKAIGRRGYSSLTVLYCLAAPAAAALWWQRQPRLAAWAAAVAIISFMVAAWYQVDLQPLPVTGKSLDERLSGDVLSRLQPGSQLTPRQLWQALQDHWQVRFITNHLLLPGDLLAEQLSQSADDLNAVWETARQLADDSGLAALEPGQLAAAVLSTSPSIKDFLRHMKLSPDDVRDVADWLGRGLSAMRADRPFFGGIGRDWANGYTPHLSRFAHNVSQIIERYGAHYSWLAQSPTVEALEQQLAQSAGAVALIGAEGSGKTSHVYALAQRLLQAHRNHLQVMSLNPALILSSARYPGQLEDIVYSLFEEAAHAGHIVMFLDDAQLFLASGPGSFDASQLLLPIVRNGAVKLIMALTPPDYERLRAANPTFAGLLTPLVLPESSQADTMRVLEDSAIGLESQHHLLISYEALREAYRLSGRYEQDMAYPGKALRLLEQALPLAEHGAVTAGSVQRAIERTKGVKVSGATQPEADSLLQLEDHIHQRMINQSRAVSVVAAALRRARSGVADPKRPLGSFLFLGPTGVGKTELARSLAAVYFGDEKSMLRLDMSEYQQPSDVQRLLSDGRQEAGSLLMAIRRQPFSVVLLDELEKAHPNVLNLLLQLLDEGQLTDLGGRSASFKDSIIIATSNAGANEIRERIGRGEQLESFEAEFTDSLITSGQFKPELLNRFDEIVLFRPLNESELAQVVGLLLANLNQTLASQHITIELTPAAVQAIVKAGNDPRLGARPLRRKLQTAVEDSLAKRILSGEVQAGQQVIMDVADLSL